jgi:hypothetical protein
MTPLKSKMIARITGATLPNLVRRPQAADLVRFPGLEYSRAGTGSFPACRAH